MSRPLRIEFAIYHVTSHGDRRELIYRDDEDRGGHLAVIAQALDRFDGSKVGVRAPSFRVYGRSDPRLAGAGLRRQAAQFGRTAVGR
jgi:hypothetical protein